MADSPASTPLQLAAMIAAVTATTVLTVMFSSASRERVRGQTKTVNPAIISPMRLGVQGRLIAGNSIHEVSWTTLDLTLGAGQSFDEVATHELEAEFIVTFRPASNRRAQIGALLQGGSLIIMRDDEVLLSDYAGAEPKLTMTRLPVWLPRRIERLKIQFKRDEQLAVRLQAMWQPEEATQARPLR